MTTAHSPASAAAPAAPRPTFVVTVRTADGSDARTMITARNEGDALRRAVKQGLNVKAVRLANVRPENAPRPAVKAAPVAKPAPVAAAPRAAVVRRPALTAEQRAADQAFEREFAALLADEARENAARAERVYWLTGEGKRPALAAPIAAPVAGEPRNEITARPRPGVGAPFVGDASKTRPDQHARAAHEYVPVRDVAPVWAPRAAAAV